MRTSRIKFSKSDTIEHDVWEGVRNRLASLTIGTCSCDTKSPELKYHSETCRYRVAREALELMPALEPPLPAEPAALQPEWVMVPRGVADELLEASRKALIVTGPEIKARNEFVWERLSTARIAFTAKLAASPPPPSVSEPVAWRWRSLKGGWGSRWHVETNQASVSWREPSHYQVQALGVIAIPAVTDEKEGDWQKSAFATTIELATKCGMQHYGTLGLDHLKDMFARIEPSFSRAKLGRWLGWAQAALVASNCGPTLDDMKEVNRAASEKQREQPAKR